MKTLAIVLLMVGSCFAASTVDTLVARGNFKTLVNLVTQAKLVSTLTGGNFTIFAPTDDAFAKLDPAVVKTVVNDSALLTKVLTYHVVTGIVMSTAAQNELVVNTVAGIGVRFNIYSDNMNKQTVTVQGCKISTFDVTADNGVIHVIDSVMMPPEGNIVDIVSNSASHKTLLSLVLQAGIADALKNQGLTLFAPNDDAFAKLNASTLNAVKSDVTLLTSILTYHVVNSTQWSAGLYDNESATTLNGKKITITTSNGVMVNNADNTIAATVIAADVGAENGVIHVIDSVLIPPTDTSSAGVVG